MGYRSPLRSVFGRIATIVLAVLGLGVSALSQEDPAVRQLTWLINVQGQTMVWPDWTREDRMEDRFVPVPLFPTSLVSSAHERSHFRSSDLRGILQKHWIPLGLVCLFSGAIDVASMTDAEYHYRRLRLGHGVLGSALYRIDDNVPDLARRQDLDHILWMRISEHLGEPFGLTDEAAQDPFKAAVAQQITERSKGPIEAWMPAQVPLGCTLYAYVDTRRIPISTRLMRTYHRYRARMIREQIRGVGALLRDWQVLAAQEEMDRVSELPYEIARRFGNLRVDRAWLACTLGRPGASVVRLDGLVEMSQLRKELKRLECAFEDLGESLRLACAGGHAEVSAASIEYRSGESQRRRSPEHDKFVGELKRAGLGGSAAIWAYLRDTSTFPLLAKAGIVNVSVSASFEGGVMVEAKASCRDEPAAEALLQTLNELRSSAAAAVVEWDSVEDGATRDPTPPEKRLVKLIESIEMSTQATTVTASLSAPGKSPEELLTTVGEGFPPRRIDVEIR